MKSFRSCYVLDIPSAPFAEGVPMSLVSLAPARNSEAGRPTSHVVPLAHEAPPAFPLRAIALLVEALAATRHTADTDPAAPPRR